MIRLIATLHIFVTLINYFVDCIDCGNIAKLGISPSKGNSKGYALAIGRRNRYERVAMEDSMGMNGYISKLITIQWKKTMMNLHC